MIDPIEGAQAGGIVSVLSTLIIWLMKLLIGKIMADMKLSIDAQGARIDLLTEHQSVTAQQVAYIRGRLLRDDDKGPK